MSQYVKDEGKASGWKVVSYANKGRKKDDEGAPVTADGMEEGADEGEDVDEPDRA